MTHAELRQPTRLVLVTGPSGAGRSTAIRVLEDLGFEAIDNLPLRLLPRLLDGPPDRAMALGIDTRNRDFSTSALLELIDVLSARIDCVTSVLYLDCNPDVLLRRFSETRRRHPLAPAESPEIGVQRDLDLLAQVRERADILIETSELNVHQLRDEVQRWFAPKDGNPNLAVTVQSFSYKRGLPRGTDMVFDCRFLSNPYWVAGLREFDGRHGEVAAYVAADPRFTPFLERVRDLLLLLLPAYVAEGKTHLSIAFGCTGGQHRSVVTAEKLANALAENDYQVSIRHRELAGREQNKEPK
jgi:UPF0042 nucleotide-binding protein